MSIECRPSVDRVSTATSTDIAVDIAVAITYSKHDPTHLDRISVICRWYIGQLSVICRSIVGGISVNCRSHISRVLV